MVALTDVSDFMTPTDLQQVIGLMKGYPESGAAVRFTQYGGAGPSVSIRHRLGGEALAVLDDADRAMFAVDQANGVRATHTPASVALAKVLTEADGRYQAVAAGKSLRLWDGSAAELAALTTKWAISDGSTVNAIVTKDWRGLFPLGADGSHALGTTGGGFTKNLQHQHAIPHSHDLPHDHAMPHNHGHNHSVTTGGPSADVSRTSGGDTAASATHTHTATTSTNSSGPSNADTGSASDDTTSGPSNTNSNNAGSTTQDVTNPYRAINYIVYVG